MSDNGSPAGSPPREEPNHNGVEEDANDETSGANEVGDNEQQGAAAEASEKASEVADDDLLSEIDEDQFEDYDPETAKIEDRPVDIDEDVARSLKVTRRKRGAEGPKKPKEGRREKKKRNRDAGEAEERDEEGRPRKSRRGDGASGGASPAPEEEEELTPEEKRRRALDRALDAAVKGPTRRRKRRGGEVRIAPRTVILHCARS